MLQWPTAHCSPPQKRNHSLDFWQQLVTMFGGHSKQSQSSATTTSIDSNVKQISEIEGKLSKNSRQCQNKINQ